MMEFLICFCMVRRKTRRKGSHCLELLSAFALVLVLYICLLQLADAMKTTCDETECWHGTCRDSKCFCDPGWQGPGCQRCGGRVRLNDSFGVLSDGIGNYSKDTKCVWLIKSTVPNATIRFQLSHFETECGWDHLYIFDGDSVFAPMVAAYSGLLLSKGSPKLLPEISTHSGSAFVYFYSDAVYNMSGFNLTYSINACPKNCSNHGPCDDGTCVCSAGWTGEACDTPICPNDCNNGTCRREEHRCSCDSGFKGPDCSVKEESPVWEDLETTGKIQGRALHQAVVFQNAMWVIGGESLTILKQQVAKFDFRTRKWNSVTPSTPTAPESFYGHSVVIYKSSFYIYGGVRHDGHVLNEFWRFDPVTLSWTSLSPSRDCQTVPCGPLAAVGHTANIVNNTMLVIFGHHPVYGYLNVVQEYTFGSGKWEIVQTDGAVVKGGFGHTSVYDPVTDQVLVFGGYHSKSTTAGAVVDCLYSYHPLNHSWTLLTPSNSHRYLHSAVLFHRTMLVFGGNTHNDTAFSTGDKCFSSEFLAYDIEYDTWNTVTAPSFVSGRLERFGHTAVIYNESMFVFGGFNGQILNDIVSFGPGSCRQFTTPDKCNSSFIGFRCVWSSKKKICHPASQKINTNHTILCERQTSCYSCLQNNYGCVWCGTGCSHKNCSKGTKVDDVALCNPAERTNCDKLHNCHACHTEFHCGWQNDRHCYTFIRETGNRTEKAVLSDNYRVKCDNSCSDRITCESCTLGDCMWCINQKKCLETNAYAATFPLAQCTEWTTESKRCSALTCQDFQTCDKCQQHQRCGWCDDGSNTGRGTCQEGSLAGPLTLNGTSYVFNKTACATRNWYFTYCPACQCNGHSTCINGTSECQQPCKDQTEGSHCQQCINGYYGNPANGGSCAPCSCNNRGTFCHRETGRCHCSTKGMTGDHCERCDEQNHYVGNLQEEGGTCFYNLSIDYQYTFNLSKPEDQYYKHINFMNTPVKPDIDVDFTLVCSTPALVNISVVTDGGIEKVLHDSDECGKIRHLFSRDEHQFGAQNTTFFIYVFNFSTPLVLQISFSQHRTLDLLQFFITFSSCFLSLLLVAAVLWKIKQKYDLYRRRQQLFVEMEQMASRPFAGVTLELDFEATDVFSQKLKKELKQNHPTPVALEPCASGKAAVLTLIVQMPKGCKEYTTAGQSGLAIASALVSLGTLSKASTEPIKDDGKSDCWKPSSHPGTCI